MTVDVRRARDRFHTRTDWLDSWHSFSFGGHYDPDNTHHGLLLVSNDDTVQPGRGFGTHSHNDMEIVTWVLSGSLAHKDSTGNDDVIYPGLAQRMSAGRGIRHSEMNASTSEPVHFVQMWVLPDTQGLEPGYEQRDISAALDEGGLVTIASGHPNGAALTIHQRDALLLGGHLAPGATVTVPDDRHVHVFVATGGGDLEGAGALATGDAVRLTDAGSLQLVAGADGCHVLIWATG